jgi:hypothetical protein
VHGNGEVVVRRSPLATSLLFGAVLQLIMVGVGRLVPALGLSGNGFPMAAAVVAMLAGLRWARRAPRGKAGPTLWGGGLAGGGSSLLGSIAAVIVMVVGGPPVQTVAVATITGGVAGMLGALVGRLLPAREPPLHFRPDSA